MIALSISMVRWHSILIFPFRGKGGVHQNANTQEQEGEIVSKQTFLHILLIHDLVHKLLGIITKSFASFIKIPFLLCSFFII